MTIAVSVPIVKFTARNIGGGFRHPPAGGRSRQLHIVLTVTNKFIGPQ